MVEPYMNTCAQCARKVFPACVWLLSTDKLACSKKCFDSLYNRAILQDLHVEVAEGHWANKDYPRVYNALQQHTPYISVHYQIIAPMTMDL